MKQDREAWDEISARMQRLIFKGVKALEKEGKISNKCAEKYEVSGVLKFSSLEGS